jgi:hypothetical protein
MKDYINRNKIFKHNLVFAKKLKSLNQNKNE